MSDKVRESSRVDLSIIGLDNREKEKGVLCMYVCMYVCIHV